MLHSFTYVSYQTIEASATLPERKVKHHVACTFDDEQMTFTAKHLGDSLEDAKGTVIEAFKPFDQPKAIDLPEEVEMRLEAGNEASDVKLPFISALAVQQFRIWVSGKVSQKDVGLSAEQIKTALAKVIDPREAMKLEFAIDMGKASVKKAAIETLRKLLA